MIPLWAEGADSVYSAAAWRHTHAFTMWLAGGGANGGLAVGSPDEFGYCAEENPALNSRVDEDN